MTWSQLAPYHVHSATEPHGRHFGAIGTKRAITKLTPSLDLNGNSSVEGQYTQMSTGSGYSLFGETAPHPHIPFQQYQSWKYPNFDTAPCAMTQQEWCQQVPSTQQLPAAPSMVNHPQHYAPPPPEYPMNSGNEPLQHLNQLNTATNDNLPFDDLTRALTRLNVSPTPSSPPSTWSDPDLASEDSDEEETGVSTSHPNKFPVEIEYHNNPHCSYRRQLKRSGPKVKQQTVTVYDPLTLQNKQHTEHIKYYKKDLVRMCRCGRYSQMDGALTHGRNNDCDGYEIHYSQKCKWKAFDDFRTGQRVLIRLCKCYKPF